MKINISSKRGIVIGILGLFVGLFFGWVFFSGSTENMDMEIHIHTDTEEYTCSMHPSVRQSEPGACPICGMDLIPVTEESKGATEFVMSESAMKLANIKTTRVSNTSGAQELNISGKVALDERKIFNQALHFPGRIEKLDVRYVGDYVRLGKKIAEIYSPALINAQEELIVSLSYKEDNPSLYNAARKKLIYWKVPEKLIDQIEKDQQVFNKIPVYAESSGYVTELNVREGNHLKEGEIIYKVANMTSLWVIFDVYERDISKVSNGSEVHFKVNSVPGRHFHGKVTYIDPYVDPATRTIPVRAEVINDDQLLKPEMYVEGSLVLDNTTDKADNLYIPQSAVLWTGARSVVYVKETEGEGVQFRMQEVEIGVRSGDTIEVLSGLKVGDEVVIEGAFTVDAAVQLSGRTSMMTPTQVNNSNETSPFDQVNEVNVSSENPVPSTFKFQLKNAYIYYLELKDALVATDSKLASETSQEMLQSLKKVDMTLVKGNDHMKWMDNLLRMEMAIQQMEGLDVEEQRQAFSKLTSGLIDAIKYFGLEGEKVYYQYCPMAFNNQGDYWLSNSEEVLNPYFGDKMLRCGSVVEVIDFQVN